MTTGQKAALAFVFLWFFGGGIGHFVPAGHAFFVNIVPPYLPNPSALVYISGVFELLGAFGILYAPTRQWAGWGLIALTLAVTPANFNMWLHPDQFPEMPQWAYAVRLVIQVGLLWCIWWSTKPRTAAA